MNCFILSDKFGAGWKLYFFYINTLLMSRIICRAIFIATLLQSRVNSVNARWKTDLMPQKDVKQNYGNAKKKSVKSHRQLRNNWKIITKKSCKQEYPCGERIDHSHTNAGIFTCIQLFSHHLMISRNAKIKVK